MTRETGCKVLGERIRNAREQRWHASYMREWSRRRTWSQEGLAAQLGISRATLAQIELGGRAPSLATWRELARLLELDPADVVEYRPHHRRLDQMFVRARPPAADANR